MKLFSIQLLLLFFSEFSFQEENFKWTRHLAAGNKNIYNIFWAFDSNNITFEVQVATKGYVGLGFSPNGGMAGSDIVVGWVKDGKPYLQDRHGIGNSQPILDQSQNYQLLKGYENQTHTVLRFTRKIAACDPNDFHLTNSTTRIIYAWHPEDPTSEAKIPYHKQNRGATSTFLFRNPEAVDLRNSPDITAWDFTLPNVPVPAKETTYWCSYFQLPELEEKLHFVGYEVIMEPVELEYVHHIVVTQCTGNVSMLSEYVKTTGKDCANFEDNDAKCYSVMFGWAVGPKMYFYPEHIGFPMNESNGEPVFIAAQMHYNNPQKKQGIIDRTKFKMYLTKKLRQNEAGSFAVSVNVNITHVLPPAQPNFMTAAHCPSKCTKEFFRPEGVNVFSAGVHAHLTGRKLRLRHFRNGTELAPIMEDNFYDFNYQAAHDLSPELKFYPGDEVTVECVYDTTSRKNSTLGGEGTNDEMCMGFFTYYPALQDGYSGCVNFPDSRKIMNYFGIQELRDDGDLIKTPSELHNISASDYLHAYDWSKKTPADIKLLENLETKDIQEILCYAPNFLDFTNASYPVINTPYNPPKNC